MSTEGTLPLGLAARLAQLVPGGRVLRARALGDDEGGVATPGARKELGYGRPIRVDLETQDGATRSFVVHTARANDFGHDRRADRADAMLLAHDTFPLVPRHARALGDDEGGVATPGARKELGYGRPIRVDLETQDGATRSLVVHTARANDFGHDRRADRADAMLLAHDTFPLVPRHARALDVGAIRSDGSLLPLGDTGELYLVTEWAEGRIYADDLRRVAETGVAAPLDVARTEALARYLAALHRMPGSHAGAYVRAIRDLVGHGEGVAGIADAYADDTPYAPRERVEAIERSVLAWRHALKRRVGRLRRTHGDFHPFNIVFPEGSAEPTLLDTSRGSEGDPADDVAALSINYLFFGLAERARWADGLGVLWRRFFEVYLAEAEEDVLDVIAPFYAWRGLVIACPLWYPSTRSADRDRILAFVERALAAPRFDPAWGPEAMR